MHGIVVYPQYIEYGKPASRATVRRTDDLLEQLIDICQWLKQHGAAQVSVCGVKLKRVMTDLHKQMPALNIISVSQVEVNIHLALTTKPRHVFGDLQFAAPWVLVRSNLDVAQARTLGWLVAEDVWRKTKPEVCLELTSHEAPQLVYQSALVYLSRYHNLAVFAPEDDFTEWQEAREVAAAIAPQGNLGLYKPPDLLAAMLQMQR